MPAKVAAPKSDGVEEVPLEPLANDSFGAKIHSIAGANVGGVRNSITIFEKGAEVTGAKSYKGCCGPRGLFRYATRCCPKSETRSMIPAHRFLGMYVEKGSWPGCCQDMAMCVDNNCHCCPCCCCCCCLPSVTYQFTLTNDEELSFVTRDGMNPNDAKAIWAFIFNSIGDSGISTDKAKALAILQADGLLPKNPKALEFLPVNMMMDRAAGVDC